MSLLPRLPDGVPRLALGCMRLSDVEAAFSRTQELLGVAMDIAYCPRPAGPPICWCRKPLPGLGVVFIDRYRLNPTECTYVGEGVQDPGFARRLGFEYRHADEFFGAAKQRGPTHLHLSIEPHEH